MIFLLFNMVTMDSGNF